MPFRFRDAGRLRQARFIEHMTLFSSALGPLYRDVLCMRGDITGEAEMRTLVGIDFVKHHSFFMTADSASYNPMGRVQRRVKKAGNHANVGADVASP